MSSLTHFDNQGHAHMVDVAAKANTHRIAGIMAAKKTSDLIPLCHPLALTRVSIEFETKVADTTGVACIICTATVETVGPTGVEMEALTAVQIALLTIYDMCKAVDPGHDDYQCEVAGKTWGEVGELY